MMGIADLGRALADGLRDAIKSVTTHIVDRIQQMSGEGMEVVEYAEADRAHVDVFPYRAFPYVPEEIWRRKADTYQPVSWKCTTHWYMDATYGGPQFYPELEGIQPPVVPDIKVVVEEVKEDIKESIVQRLKSAIAGAILGRR